MKSGIMLKVLAMSTVMGIGSLINASAVIYNFETPDQIDDWSFSGSSGPNAIVVGGGVDGGNALSWSSIYNGPYATTTLTGFSFSGDVDISLQYARSFDNFELILSNGSSSVSLIHSDFWFGGLASNNDPVWDISGNFNTLSFAVRDGILNGSVNGTVVSVNQNVASVFDGSDVTLSIRIFGGSDTTGTTPNYGYLDNVTVNPIPEPSTFALIALCAGGLVGAGLSKRRRLCSK